MSQLTKDAKPLTPEEFKDYKFHCNSVRINLQTVTDATEEIGESLQVIRDRKLYRQDYDTFADFVSSEYGKTARWAYQKLDEIRVLTNIQKCEQPVHKMPGTEQARKLATLPNEEQADAWGDGESVSRPGYVYIVFNGYDAYKIGSTTRDDVASRVRELQTANARRLTLIESFYCPEPRQLEKELKWQFIDRKIFDGGSEWFCMNANDLQAARKQAEAMV